MLGLAEKAATLSAAEWPAFFRAQLDSPESSRPLARLWAESDPAGFWKWLKEGRDSLLIERFADDLVKAWAVAQPEQAMDGLMSITDKKLGDRLRDMAIDAVIEHDFEKGDGHGRARRRLQSLRLGTQGVDEGGPCRRGQRSGRASCDQRLPPLS